MSQSADHPALLVPPEDSASGDKLPHLRAGVPWVATWVGVLSLSATISAALVVGAHGTRGFFLPVLAAAVCVLAALFDARTGRIPNPLTYTAILLGLGLNALMPLLQTARQGSGDLARAAGPKASLWGSPCCGIWAFSSTIGGNARRRPQIAGGDRRHPGSHRNRQLC